MPAHAKRQAFPFRIPRFKSLRFLRLLLFENQFKVQGSKFKVGWASALVEARTRNGELCPRPPLACEPHRGSDR